MSAKCQPAFEEASITPSTFVRASTERVGDRVMRLRGRASPPHADPCSTASSAMRPDRSHCATAGSHPGPIPSVVAIYIAPSREVAVTRDLHPRRYCREQSCLSNPKRNPSQSASVWASIPEIAKSHDHSPVRLIFLRWHSPVRLIFPKRHSPAGVTFPSAPARSRDGRAAPPNGCRRSARASSGALIERFNRRASTHRRRVPRAAVAVAAIAAAAAAVAAAVAAAAAALRSSARRARLSP